MDELLIVKTVSQEAKLKEMVMKMIIKTLVDNPNTVPPSPSPFSFGVVLLIVLILLLLLYRLRRCWRCGRIAVVVERTEEIESGREEQHEEEQKWEGGQQEHLRKVGKFKDSDKKFIISRKPKTIIYWSKNDHNRICFNSYKKLIG